MNDRARALEVLRQARAVLAERLTEQVVEQADEILADARGDSYMNEIETLYDQIGHKLTHVSQMLSNLPPEPPPTETTAATAQHRPEATFSMATETSPSADAVEANTLPALVGPIYITAPALPAPRAATASDPATPVRDRATNAALQAFAAQIQAGDLLAAGRTLAALFDLEEPRAIACAATFAQRVRLEAGFYRKVMELRGELYSSNPQRALLLLLDCFGLTRGESAEVLRTIQRRKRMIYG
jgi:hypothetical protein